MTILEAKNTYNNALEMLEWLKEEERKYKEWKEKEKEKEEEI